MKILIFGLPGSGKSTLAKPFAELIDAIWLNADQIREEYSDWDMSMDGRVRQAHRMRYLADGITKAGRAVVADFVCPTEQTRRNFGADYTVWMDTIEQSQYEDTNLMFEKPIKCDYHVAQWFDDTPEQLKPVVERWRARHGV